MAAGTLSDIDTIDPPPRTIKLSNGSAVDLKRLGTLELFGLLRILTHGGMGAGILNALNFQATGEEFATQIITLLIMSIPDAGPETLQFVRSMCVPHGLEEGAKLSRQQEKDNQQRYQAAREFLDNPPPEDTLAILEAIIEQEAPEFQALGKRLARTVELFQRTGQDKDSTAQPAESPATP